MAVRLSYLDALGNEATWDYGFYIQNDPEQPNRTKDADVLQPDTWNPYDFNLFDPATLVRPPVYLKSLQFYSAGRGYDASVTDISLAAQ